MKKRVGSPSGARSIPLYYRVAFKFAALFMVSLRLREDEATVTRSLVTERGDKNENKIERVRDAACRDVKRRPSKFVRS